MKKQLRNRLLAVSMLPLGCGLLAPSAFAGTIVLNFDSVSVPGNRVDATAYLASFGITFEAITPESIPTIENTLAPGSAAIAPSSPNVFDVAGATGPAAVSYELLFSSPLDSLSFTRAGIISVSGDAPWSAEALNSHGDIVASASEGFLIGPSARTFSFAGPGIAALRIDARNDLTRTTFNDPPIDDLTLVSSTPEPRSLSLAILALSGFLVGMRFRAARDL